MNICHVGVARTLKQSTWGLDGDLYEEHMISEVENTALLRSTSPSVTVVELD